MTLLLTLAYEFTKRRHRVKYELTSKVKKKIVKLRNLPNFSSLHVIFKKISVKITGILISISYL